MLAQKFFDLLRSFADVIDVLAGAGRTLRRSAVMMIAIMANQSAIGLMVRKRHVAIWTIDRFPARATQNETRIATTIQKDDRLLVASVSLIDGTQELVGKDRRLLAPGKNLAHVDHLSPGHRA